MLAAPLCKCICGVHRRADLDGHLESFNEVEEPPLRQIAHKGLLSYYDAADQPMRGVPIREGRVWIMSAEEQVEPIKLSLYVSGLAFSFGGREVSLAFSPFALVRNCKFQINTLGGAELSVYKCFKVALYTQGLCFYFGVKAEDEQASEEARSQWVLDVSRAMRLVTQSLFPVHEIVSTPVRSQSSTHRRLMAGYLIHYDGCCVASVVYCELHPQSSLGHAKLVLYEDEACQVLVNEILVTETSTCCEKVGINCSCFSIEDHQFSSRTLPERRLWLRAISNLKVKLQNRAPSPSGEELDHYRLSIQEHVISDIGVQSQAPMDALLQRFPPKAAEAASGGAPERPSGDSGGPNGEQGNQVIKASSPRATSGVIDEGGTGGAAVHADACDADAGGPVDAPTAGSGSSGELRCQADVRSDELGGGHGGALAERLVFGAPAQAALPEEPPPLAPRGSAPTRSEAAPGAVQPEVVVMQTRAAAKEVGDLASIAAAHDVGRGVAY